MVVLKQRAASLTLIGLTACGSATQPGGTPRELRPRAVTAAPTSGKPDQAQGQWLWTRRDLAIFERSRRRLPELSAGVFIGELECAQGRVALRRGLSPLIAGAAARALVVRLGDSMQACFAELDADDLAKDLDDRFSKLLREANETGVHFRELQLDYDAPVSKLEGYARLLRYLRAHSLNGVELWITSIPSHLERPGYGLALRGVVTGHIIQVFDTGLRCNDQEASRLHAALEAEGLPYRVGYGTFERAGAAPDRSHRCWLSVTRSWHADANFFGFWLFPAGVGDDAALAMVSP